MDNGRGANKGEVQDFARTDEGGIDNLGAEHLKETSEIDGGNEREISEREQHKL